MIEEVEKEIALDRRIEIGHRCQYCGKQQKPNSVGGFCNNKCRRAMEKIWDDREAKGLCRSCGRKTEGDPKKISSCKFCVKKIQRLMQEADYFYKEAQKEFKTP